jgi:hypothetical protein
MWTRTLEVARKVEKYAGMWLRILDSGGTKSRVRPVVWLLPRAAQAEGLARRLSSAAREGMLPRYAALSRRIGDAGPFFTFGGWDEISERGTLPDCYHPLDHSDGEPALRSHGQPLSLYDALNVLSQ